MTFYKPFFTAELAALRRLLRDTRVTQEMLAAKLRELFPDDFAKAPRSTVSLVLIGKRGAKNSTLAEQFRHAAIELVKAHLATRDEADSALVPALLAPMKAAAAEAGADDKAFAELPLVAKLQPLAIPPRAAVVRAIADPISALGDYPANRIKTAPLLAAVDYAAEKTSFNMVVSGPRYSGVSTMLNAVEFAVREKNPEAQVCRFDVPESPFAKEFGDKVKLTDESTATRANAADFSKVFAGLQGDIADAWKLEDDSSVKTAQELNRWLRRQLTAPGLPQVPRLLVLDNLDPSDLMLGMDFLDLAVLLDALRVSTGAFSIVVGAQYRARLLATLGPELRSASAVLQERWKHFQTVPLTAPQTGELAATLAPSGSGEKLAALVAEDAKWMQGHPAVTHAVAYWQAARLKSTTPGEVTSLRAALQRGTMARADLHPGILRQWDHLREVAGVLGIPVATWQPQSGSYMSPEAFFAIKDWFPANDAGAERKTMVIAFLQCADILDSTGTRWVWDELMKLNWPT